MHMKLTDDRIIKVAPRKDVNTLKSLAGRRKQDKRSEQAFLRMLTRILNS